MEDAETQHKEKNIEKKYFHVEIWTEEGLEMIINNFTVFSQI